MQIRYLLKLIRLPNLFTAACNSLAGAFCAGVCFDRSFDLTLLAVSSMSLYAAGILLNDMFDLNEDRRERPERPLPAGKVSVRLAATLAIVLCLLGLLTAMWVSRMVGSLALILLAAIIAYDAGLKRTPAGPSAMGLCRALNLGMGLAVLPIRPWGYAAMAGYLFYISGITYISRQETHTGQTKGLGMGFFLIVAGIVFVLTGILLETNLHQDLFSPGKGKDFPALLSVFLLFILIKLISKAWQTAMRDPKPATIQNIVKTGIISFPLVDLSLTMSLAGMMQAGVILMLWMMARLTSRRLYTT